MPDDSASDDDASNDGQPLQQAGIMQTVPGSPLADTGQTVPPDQSETASAADTASTAASIQTAAGSQDVGAEQIADTTPAAGSAAPGAAGSKPATPPADDDKTVHIIADEVGYDQDLGLFVARGHVQVRRADKTTFADTVAYNERTKRITASGHV
ncbi:MAG: hypothetical protein ABWY00_18275, partial [Dongiaceae bacterium]